MAAAALAATLTGVAVQGAPAQDSRTAKTVSRMHLERGPRGIWVVEATRVSPTQVRIYAGGAFERPGSEQLIARIRCLTQEYEQVCQQEVGVTIREGGRAERQCTAAILRERTRRERLRGCRRVRPPRATAIGAVVTGAGEGGAAAEVYEVQVDLVDERGGIVSTSGLLAPPG
jgi:hypothetical protein